MKAMLRQLKVQGGESSGSRRAAPGAVVRWPPRFQLACVAVLRAFACSSCPHRSVVSALEAGALLPVEALEAMLQNCFVWWQAGAKPLLGRTSHPELTCFQKVLTLCYCT